MHGWYLALASALTTIPLGEPARADGPRMEEIALRRTYACCALVAPSRREGPSERQRHRLLKVLPEVRHDFVAHPHVPPLSGYADTSTRHSSLPLSRFPRSKSRRSAPAFFWQRRVGPTPGSPHQGPNGEARMLGLHPR